MALATKVSQYVSPEEYLALEKNAEHKSEYFNGEIFMMAGASPNHNRIALNVSAELNVRLRGSTCEAFNSDQRLRIKKNGLYTYPDAMVICGSIEFDELDDDAVTNPLLIVEVLSPSTANYDRGQKFELYRDLETLRDYVVIHQDKLYIEYYHKAEDGRWVLTEMRDPNGELTLQTLDFALPLSRVYERVSWLSDSTT